MLCGNSIWWRRVHRRANKRGVFNLTATLGTLRNNAKLIASAEGIRDLAMELITTLFIAVGLLVGLMVMWIGFLAVGIWVFLFMLTYLS